MKVDYGLGNNITHDFYKVTYHTYKVIAPLNVYLGDDSIVEEVGMGFIIVKVLMKVIKMIYIRNVLYVSKLQAILLLLSKLLSNGLKMKFNTNESNVM